MVRLAGSSCLSALTIFALRLLLFAQTFEMIHVCFSEYALPRKSQDHIITGLSVFTLSVFTLLGLTAPHDFGQAQQSEEKVKHRKASDNTVPSFPW